MYQIKTSAVTRAGASVGKTEALAEAARAVLAGFELLRRPGRVAGEGEVAAIGVELREAREKLTTTYLRAAATAAARGADTAAQVKVILRKASMSVEKTGYDDPVRARHLDASLRAAVEQRAPLALALLMGGAKVPNPLKTGDAVEPDASEWLAWIHLAALAAAAAAVHTPGARVFAIPDAGLHTGDLAVSYPEAAAHLRTVQRDLEWLGLQDHVLVPNTVQYLPPSWSASVRSLVADVQSRLGRDRGFRADVQSQIESLAYSMNTRAAGWPFEHAVLVYAALAGPTRGLPGAPRVEAAELYRWAERNAAHYVAVNHAIRTEDLVGRIVEAHTGGRLHVRMSVHAKDGEPRPVLMAPNHLTRAGLLPMHGLAQRTTGPAPKWGNTFELEARVAGHTPVIDRASGRFLYFEVSEG